LPKTELGLYFLADRIVRSALSAGDPLYALVYPRIVGLFGRGADGARAALRHAARWALGGAALGAVMLVLGELAWPALSRWLASRAGGFDLPALHRVLQVLAWLLPLLLGWKFLGYWMLGSGRYDRAYRACVVVGGIVGVASALSIGGSAGALGLAWTALGVELVVIGVALAGIGLARRSRAAAP
jgi:hypothetical protein